VAPSPVGPLGPFHMPKQMAECAPPQRQADVSRAVMELQHEVEGLERRLQGLVERLSPVTASALPTNEPANVNGVCDRLGRCDLSVAISVQTQRLTALIVMLEDLVGRLEV